MDEVLDSVVFIKPAWASYAIILGALVIVIGIISWICCCYCHCCCYKNKGSEAQDLEFTVAVNKTGSFVANASYDEEQFDEPVREPEWTEADNGDGHPRSRPRTATKRLNPNERRKLQQEALEVEVDYERERKATKRLDPSSKPKASDFKSWQKFHDAVEGKVVQSSESVGILKSGDKLRRQDSTQRIEAWREEVKREKGSIGSIHAGISDDGPASVRRTSKRRISVVKEDGSSVTETEEYEVSADNVDVMQTLERKLSRRTSVKEMFSRRLLFPENEVTGVVELEPTDRKVNPVWHGLTAEQKLFIRKELNELKSEMKVHESSKSNTRFHEDGPIFSGFAKRIGERVTVIGYDCEGTLKFFGPHKTQPGARAGVELDEPIGKNSGKVKGHRYFQCRPRHGVLVFPKKVQFLKGPQPAMQIADPKAKPVVKRRTPRSSIAKDNDNEPASRASRALSHVMCIAKHTFEPTHEDELRFVKGEKIIIVTAPVGGWWKGELNGESGWFPANHVEVVRNEDSTGRQRSMSSEKRPRSFFSLHSDFDTDDDLVGTDNDDEGEASDSIEKESANGSNSLFSGDGETPVCIALHKYIAQHTDELSFETGDVIEIIQSPAGGWWQGQLFFDTGWFPCNFVESGGSVSPSKLEEQSTPNLDDTAAKFGWRIFKAIADFVPRHDDEVSIVKGQEVLVMQEIDGGWWEVTCNGKSGWVPRGMLDEVPVGVKTDIPGTDIAINSSA